MNLKTCSWAELLDLQRTINKLVEAGCEPFYRNQKEVVCSDVVMKETKK